MEKRGQKMKISEPMKELLQDYKNLKQIQLEYGLKVANDSSNIDIIENLEKINKKVAKISEKIAQSLLFYV